MLFGRAPALPPLHIRPMLQQDQGRATLAHWLPLVAARRIPHTGEYESGCWRGG